MLETVIDVVFWFLLTVLVVDVVIVIYTVSCFTYDRWQRRKGRAV